MSKLFFSALLALALLSGTDIVLPSVTDAKTPTTFTWPTSPSGGLPSITAKEWNGAAGFVHERMEGIVVGNSESCLVLYLNGKGALIEKSSDTPRTILLVTRAQRNPAENSLPCFQQMEKALNLKGSRDYTGLAQTLKGVETKAVERYPKNQSSGSKASLGKWNSHGLMIEARVEDGIIVLSIS